MAEPIHTTEMRTYMSCRLKWYFTAPRPRGQYLTPKVKKAELRLGGMAHDVIRAWYDSGRDLDVEETVDRMVQKYIDTQAVTWPELESKFRDEGALLKKMISGYTKWAEKVDDGCNVIATETPWMVRYTPFLTMAGRFDGLIERPDGLWVLEFKTTSSQPGNTGWAGRALQNVSYATAAHKLYGDEVRGVLYRFLRKKTPWTYEDLVLKSGGLTTRSNIADLTTLEEYHRALMIGAYIDVYSMPGYEVTPNRARAGIREIYQEHDGNLAADEALWAQYKMWMAAHRDALTRLQEHGRNNFFWEQAEYSTHDQRERYTNAVILPMLKEMTSKPFPTPTGLGASWALCGRCSFRTPCDLLLTGGDWRGELERNYVTRSDYEAVNR